MYILKAYNDSNKQSVKQKKCIYNSNVLINI
jgi:hypothetical protein